MAGRKPVNNRKERRRLASLADAAEYLAISERTLRRYIAAGQLPAYRIGRGPKGLLRVDMNEVEAMPHKIPTTDGPTAE